MKLMVSQKFYKNQFSGAVLAVLLLVPVYATAKDATKQRVVPLDEELKFKAGDEEGNELKALKTELLINRSDERALDQLKKLLVKYRGSPMEPSLHFRLAELYMRRAKTATFFEVHRDDSNAVKFSPLEVKSASSKGWIKKAIVTYDLIEKKFSHFRDMDLVLFNNAFARDIIGDGAAAVARYKKVVDDFSSSPLVPDCHLAIGEALFNKKAFQASYDELQKIRQFPDSRVFPYGLYKGAWALYNLSKAPEGLKQLEEVVSYAKTQKDESAAHLDLSREALDDMVVFFEDVKKPTEGVSYFREQAGDAHAGDLVLKLGKLYQRHSRYANLEIIFTDLISAVPMAAERPKMHHDLMDSFEISKKHDKVIEHLETLASICVETSKWATGRRAEEKNLCWENLEEAGKVYSSKWHHDFRKNQAVPESLQMAKNARHAYEALLNTEHHIDGEDKMRFTYSELLFQLGDFSKSSAQYSRVAHLTKDAKLRHDSSYAALVALEKSVGDKWPDKEEIEFNRLAVDYLTLNPKGEYVNDIKFKRAFIAYDKGRFAEAAPQFKTLALQFNGTERGHKAAQLYLDILNLQKQFSLLADESLMFVKKLNLDPGSRAEFLKIHQQASFTVVQNIEGAEKYQEAIKGYLDLVKNDPQSPFADKALYNSVRCANLAGDLKQAASLSEKLFDKYPQSSFRLELAHNLVTLYEAQAQLGLASRTLVRLSEWEKDKTTSLLLSAADYRALNNEWDDAVKIYNQLAQKHLQTSDGRTALERLAAYAEKNQQADKASHVYQQIEDLGIQPQASLASLKQAQKAFSENNEDKAFKLAKKTVSMRNESKVSKWALAQARLIQAKILEHEFDQVSVKAKPERLAMVLSIKTEKLDHTQKAYQETIGFGDPQTSIEALIRLARCYEKFSSALNSIPAPADASEADKKKFSLEMENMALPIEERNAETLQVALKQAKTFNLHDETVSKIQAELNRLSKRSKQQTVVELSTPENVLPVVN